MKTVQQVIRGAQIISEWLGAGGKPVPVMQAERRAAICATCTHNVKGGWLERLKAPVVGLIKDHLEIKNGLGITLSNEDQIGFCSGCGCVLSLKCWTPIDHIMSHTPQNEVSQYPDRCWIRKELAEL